MKTLSNTAKLYDNFVSKVQGPPALEDQNVFVFISIITDRNIHNNIDVNHLKCYNMSTWNNQK